MTIIRDRHMLQLAILPVMPLQHHLQAGTFSAWVKLLIVVLYHRQDPVSLASVIFRCSAVF